MFLSHKDKLGYKLNSVKQSAKACTRYSWKLLMFFTLSALFYYLVPVVTKSAYDAERLTTAVAPYGTRSRDCRILYQSNHHGLPRTPIARGLQTIASTSKKAANACSLWERAGGSRFAVWMWLVTNHMGHNHTYLAQPDVATSSKHTHIQEGLTSRKPTTIEQVHRGTHL